MRKKPRQGPPPKRRRVVRRTLIYTPPPPAERAFHLACWDERSPGQRLPRWVVARQLTKSERFQAYLAKRLSPAFGIATIAALSLRAPIPDPADPENPARFRGGDLIFQPNDAAALVRWVDALTPAALFAMGLEAAQGGG